MRRGEGVGVRGRGRGGQVFISEQSVSVGAKTDLAKIGSSRVGINYNQSNIEIV